jgi:hypothetical protein
MNRYWQWPTLGVGWILAGIVLVADVILGYQGALSKEAAFVIAAICAVRL